nr:transcriptional regulator [Rhodococcus sp. B10]
MVRILTNQPRLSGAACVGRSEVFDPAETGEDPDDVRYRHEVAASICRTCPALNSCRDWAETERASGSVIAERARYTRRKAASIQQPVLF